MSTSTKSSRASNVIEFAPHFDRSKRVEFNDAVYDAVQLYKYDHDAYKLTESLLDLEFPKKSIDIMLDGGYFDELEVHEMDEIFIEVIHPSWDVPEPANDE